MRGLLHITDSLFQKGSGICIVIGVILLIGGLAFSFWMWNDERKTRKSIQNMADIQAKSLQMNQTNNGFAPPPNQGTATKWGK